MIEDIETYVLVWKTGCNCKSCRINREAYEQIKNKVKSTNAELNEGES